MINSLTIISAFIAVFISNVFAFQMKMNTLYLTASGNSVSVFNTVGADQNSVVSQMLDSYGMNYEIVHLPVTSLVLEEGNTALYNSIVVEGATAELLVGVKEQIEQYQQKYKIRVAYLNCEPDASLGANSIQTVAMRNMTLTNEGFQLAQNYQMNGKDVPFEVGTCVLDANFQCIQYHHYEVTFQNPSVTPLLKYVEVDAYAGALVNSNGIESIHFWIPYIDSHIAFFSSHLWISWTNYGMIDGFRRLYFEIQIDDYFTDNCFNSSDCSNVPDAPHYRTSVQDMINLGQWQKDVSGRLPNGSNIRIELAINGIHILTKANHKQFVAQDWTDYQTTYDYKKPLDEHGSVRWGDNVDSDWDDNILQQNDPLYKYFKEPEHQDDFFWLTHTFSHQKLDYASYHDADTEMKLNIKMSSQPYLGMYERPCYSPHSIVTPEISGLHNGDALRALTENQVLYAVGDTSRTDLSPANFYLPFVSNMTSSNFDGFLAIPRQPPQIYWDCSLIEENLALYQERYGQPIEWNTHLNNEAALHVKNFLKLRHDPYMFHEGNLRNDDYPEIVIGTAQGKFGLMQQWVERMVVELNKYLNWPLISLKMDDLAQTYIERLNKESCKPEYVMDIDDATNIIKEIKVSTLGEGSCKVPFFAMRSAGFDQSTATIEKIGDEPETAWVDLKAGETKSIKFAKEVKYNDEAFVGKTLASNSSSSRGFSLSSLFSGYKLYIWIALFALIIAIVVFLIFGRRKGTTVTAPIQSSSSPQKTYNSPASYNFEHQQQQDYANVMKNYERQQQPNQMNTMNQYYANDYNQYERQFQQQQQQQQRQQRLQQNSPNSMNNYDYNNRYYDRNNRKGDYNLGQRTSTLDRQRQRSYYNEGQRDYNNYRVLQEH